jgi:hypothetical protein
LIGRCRAADRGIIYSLQCKLSTFPYSQSTIPLKYALSATREYCRSLPQYYRSMPFCRSPPYRSSPPNACSLAHARLPIHRRQTPGEGRRLGAAPNSLQSRALCCLGLVCHPVLARRRRALCQMRPCRVTQERAEGPSMAREHTIFRSGAGRSAIQLPFFSSEHARFRGQPHTCLCLRPWPRSPFHL